MGGGGLLVNHSTTPFLSDIVSILWRGDRVVDGNGLENRRGATHREFESRPLRQRKDTRTGVFSLAE